MSFSRFSTVPKVMVTGIGACTPLGITLNETWQNLLKGYTATKRHDFPRHPNIPCKVAATIPREDDPQTIENLSEANNNPPSQAVFKPSEWLSKSESIFHAHLIQYSLAAASQAIATSGLDAHVHIKGQEPPAKSANDFILDTDRVAVCFASGIGGMDILQSDIIKLHDISHKKIGPYTMPNILPNTSAGAICMRYGFHGPNLSCSTACAASSHAIHEGFLLLTHGLCDVAVVGGADSSVTPFGMAAFNRCKAVTTKHNDTPGQASRPFDRLRSGFVMGEGAGVLVLETEEHARKRGVTDFYAQLVGCSATSDAYHVTAVEPSGKYVRKCMQNALEMAAAVTNDSDILSKLGYVNAHATSTPVGDGTELKAILDCLQDNYYRAQDSPLMVSSTKGSLGHLLGGTGAVEACFTTKVLKERIAPPTINLTEPDEELPPFVNLVPHQPQQVGEQCEYAMSNSFGFGGTNGSLLFKRVN